MKISSWGYDEDFEAIYNSRPDIYSKFNNKHILITGSTGLVGVCMVEFLAYLKMVKNINLRITAMSSSKENAHNRLGHLATHKIIDILIHDVRDSLPVNNKFDYIIHAASIANPKLYEEAPVDVINTTIAGTENILNYGKMNPDCNTLFVSSVEVYGDTSHLESEITEEVYGHVDPYSVRSSYTEAKRLAETLCKAYESQYNVSCSVARLSKTYGPSNSPSDRRVMAHILKTSSEGKNITLNSDGSRVFSFCYVTDSISALATILLCGKSGEAYNVSDKDSIASLKDITKTAARIAKVEAFFTESTGLAAISKDTVVDSQKLEALGWTPGTNLEQGLRKQFYGVISTL